MEYFNATIKDKSYVSAKDIAEAIKEVEKRIDSMYQEDCIYDEYSIQAMGAYIALSELEEVLQIKYE